jgi:outer membrane protein OmpA-like peptidoglycan-associated protein
MRLIVLARLAVSLGIPLLPVTAGAQSNGKYELLNESQIVRQLSGGVQPAASQTRGTISQIPNIGSGGVAVEVVIRDYGLLKTLPSVVLGRLVFNTSSSELSPQSAQSLHKLASALKMMIRSSPNEVFLIEGHTDFPGSSDLNEKLSLSRAQAVNDYLVGLGAVPSRNLVYYGYGRSHLVVKTEKAEASNRRVEVRRLTSLISFLPQRISIAPSKCDPNAQFARWRLDIKGFSKRSDRSFVKDSISELRLLRSHNLIEENDGFSSYSLSLINLAKGCELYEALEDVLLKANVDLEKTVALSINGSVIRIEKK